MRLTQAQELSPWQRKRSKKPKPSTLLGGSGVVISRVIRWVISIATLLIALLITTHEPPSKSSGRRLEVWGLGSLGDGHLDL